MALQVNIGDQITVTHSPYVWKVTKTNDNGTFTAKNCDGKKSTFGPFDVLAVVQRKTDPRGV